MIRIMLVFLCLSMFLALGLNYYKRISEAKANENLKIYAANQVKAEAELAVQHLQQDGLERYFTKFMGSELHQEELFDHLKNQAKSCGLQQLTGDFKGLNIEQNYGLQMVELNAQAHHDSAFYCLVYALEHFVPFYVWITDMEFKREVAEESGKIIGIIKFHIIHWRAS